MFKKLLKAIILAPMTLMFGIDGGNPVDNINESKENTGDVGIENKITNGVNETNQQVNVGQRTFTQAEVSAMMAKEKAQGKLSVLKELGVEDVKNAKEGLAKYQEYLNSQKSDLQKAQDDIIAEKVARENAEKQAKLLSTKLEALTLGVKSNCIDDVVAIALLKVTDDKSMSDVIKELKEKEEYKGFFSDAISNQSNGTGLNLNVQKPNSNINDNIGKRLGEKVAKTNTKKQSSFFKS